MLLCLFYLSFYIFCITHFENIKKEKNMKKEKKEAKIKEKNVKE